MNRRMKMATAIPVKRMWTYADLEELPEDGHIYDILGDSSSCATRRMPITPSC